MSPQEVFQQLVTVRGLLLAAVDLNEHETSPTLSMDAIRLAERRLQSVIDGLFLAEEDACSEVEHVN